MTLTVHTISGAPRPWRVLVALALKGIPWDQHVLNASDGEHKSEPFLSLNPRGTVPVVEADGIVIRDSIATLAWLDRRYPEPPLFGATPDEAARIWQITMEACDYMREANRAVLVPVLLRRLDPVPGSKEEKALIESSRKLHAECRWLESLLADGPYLVGGAPSAADVVVFPEIRLIQRTVENHHEVMDRLGFGYPPELYPRVSDWKARMSELPGIEDTLPPHWKEQEKVQSMRNYKKTLIVDAKPEQAFEALTKGFEHWWTAPDQPIRNEGDRARFTFPPGRSYWIFEAKKLVHGKRVELECVEALHVHDGMPREIETEWLGTRTIWTISPEENGARIRFEHVGLSPSLHCYEVCEEGWDRFFVDSLKAYLDTGTGRPHRPPV